MPATTPPTAREPGVTNTFTGKPTPSESPPSLGYLTAGGTAYRCLHLDYTKPTVAVSTTRPIITAAIAVKPNDDLDLMRTALRGGTVAILTPDGRTITGNGVKIESYRDLLTEPGFFPTRDGSTIVLVKLSVDPITYSST